MKTRMTRSLFILSLVALTVLTVLPPDGNTQITSQDASPSVNHQKAVYRLIGNEGTITGMIGFTGKSPKRTTIDMHADAACAETKSDKLTEDVLVADGKLANVVVYVKSSSILELYQFEVPSEPVVLEHKNCRYVPHVFGVRVDQTLRVLNVDPTSHNTNLSNLFTKQSRNTFQGPGGPAIEWAFSQPEAFLPFKCNQHPWERAYVGIFTHSFFSVSDDHGSYRIEGLPPGVYTIVAWHETLGEQTIDITIAPHESRTLNFMFE